MRLLWHSYRYFPYERVLARREAECFLGVEIRTAEDALVAEGARIDEQYLRRLTYFKGIEVGERIIVPDQARLEASASGNGQRLLPIESEMPNLRRQSTRYSAHGLHEYRGKFHPQIVRVIGNLLGLGPGCHVLDPFCGSGTTLLEAAHLGWNAVGLDINPLGIYIANAKVAAFREPSSQLTAETDDLVHRLQSRAGNITPVPWTAFLPNQEYLESWFAKPVLEQLALIIREIDQVRTNTLKPVFRVILSDICRQVSLQDPGDLRIRRRKDAAATYDAISLFVDSVQSKVSSIIRAKQEILASNGRQIALLGDSRRAKSVLSNPSAGLGDQQFDAAICSPPYATALPYIDTQRLSLCLLGLVRSDELRDLERTLIGNREISDAERRRLEDEIAKNSEKLPANVVEFCLHLRERAASPSHGFRRRNIPGLVFKYFSEMALMFDSVHEVVKPGGAFALVVGANRTCLQGQDIAINTPELLADIAGSRGWSVNEVIELDTYQRYDVHQENSIRQERLVVLTRQG